MKTIEQIQKTLQAFSNKYGVETQGVDQGSAQWMAIKLGVLSASNASKIVAKKGTATRDTYMAELVAQVATGIFPEINAKALDWGNDHENAARSTYQFATGDKLVEVPFVFADETFRYGASPDFLVPEKKRGAEIKCPWNSANYVLFLVSEKLKSEWDWQAQFQMFCTGAEVWDFVQFDPRMKKNPIKIHTLKRDEKKQKTLADAVPQFIADMDKMLEACGFEFGEHWARLAKSKAA